MTKHITVPAWNLISQIPNSLMAESDDLAKLLQAYARFSSVPGSNTHTIETLPENLRIENMVKEFRDKVVSELGVGFPAQFEADPEIVYSRLTEFYEQKGTKDSFRFFFRALFDTEVHVFEPGDLVFKASDGLWFRPFLYVFEPNDLAEFLNLWKPYQKLTLFFGGRPIDFFGYELKNNVVFLFSEQEFPSGLSPESNLGTLLPQISKYEILEAGFGFEAGRSFSLFDNSFQIDIVKTDISGRIQALNFSSGNTSLPPVFQVKLFPNGRFEVVESGSNQNLFDLAPLGDTLTISSEVSDYAEDYFAEDYTELTTVILRAQTDTSQSQAPQSSSPNSFFTDHIKVCDEFKIYCVTDEVLESVGYAENDYWNPEEYAEVVTSVVSGSMTLKRQIRSCSKTNLKNRAYALVEFTSGLFSEFGSGHFLAYNGFVSDQRKIHDNKYYQEFSYVMASDVPRHKYESGIGKSVHPAGTTNFSHLNLDLEHTMPTPIFESE